MFKNIFSQLLYTDCDIDNIEIYNVSFSDSVEVNYMNNGRSKNLLHLSLCGTRCYETENLKFTVEPNTIVFIPDKTKYTTHAINTDISPCNGINICFDLKGFNLFEKMIYTETDLVSKSIINEFKKINDLWTRSPLSILNLKASVFNLLSMLATICEHNSKDYVVLKPAIDYLTEHYKENLPISFFAELCNLSESYFRKTFKAYMGLSPIDYRNELRFAKAEQLYQSGQNLEQIAEAVGFCDAVFLSKLYKKRFGVSIKNRLKTV
jgi:AraC-like DNA-binding protein